VPSQPDQAIVNRVIFEELTRGRLEDASRKEYVRIMRSGCSGS